MSGFQLDTSPFAKGYAQAIRDNLPEEHRDAPLAPATLSRIIADCEAWRELWAVRRPHMHRAEDGRRLWIGRNTPGWDWPTGFPPLTVTLGDDGLIYLSEAGQ